MARRYAWSWSDYRRAAAKAKAQAAAPPRPGRPVLTVVGGTESPQMVRARELLGMGVPAALVRQCVRLSDEEARQLGRAAVA